MEVLKNNFYLTSLFNYLSDDIMKIVLKMIVDYKSQILSTRSEFLKFT